MWVFYSEESAAKFVAGNGLEFIANVLGSVFHIRRSLVEQKVTYSTPSDDGGEGENDGEDQGVQNW